MSTNLDLAEDQVSCPAGAYTAIQPPAGENWKILGLIGGNQAGNGWFVRQGANRVSLGSAMFAGDGLFISNSCYLEFYVPGANAATYAQYKAQRLAAGVTVASVVLAVLASGSATQRPSAGYIQKVGLVVGDNINLHMGLTDGTNPVADPQSIATTTSATVYCFQELWLTNSVYGRVSNNDASTHYVLISASQMAAAVLSVQTAVVAMPTGTDVDIRPAVGDVWVVNWAATSASNLAWYITDGTNSASFYTSAARLPLDAGKVVLTNSRYLRCLHGDGSTKYLAYSAVKV